MVRRSVMVALGVAVFLSGALQAWAAGVFIVSRKGVDTYNDAKAGFQQMAYSLQLPGFSAAVVDLDGSAADDTALAALKAKDPSLVYAVGSYAAKKVRQAMPDTWIVYGMVYYPESEGFVNDPKMVGVASLGPTKGLVGVLKSIVKGKTAVILNARAVDASASELANRFRADGLDAQARSVPDAAGLQAAFDAVKDSTRIIVLLPDPITANQDALRFVVSQCVSAGIAPVSLSEQLVSGGALCAAYYPPDAVGNQAARVASEILSSGKAPADRVVAPQDSATALNKGTAQALKINIPKTFRAEVTYE